MLTVEKLKAYGADTETGLSRCMNKEEFYLRLVGMMLADPSIDKFADAVDRHDLDAAFEAMHALKGIAGNLALTPIYEPASEATELLRNRTEADYTPYVKLLQEKRDELRALKESD